MAHTLTQRLRAEEVLQERTLRLSLRIAGVMTAAILVFLALYYFIAALDIP